MEGNFIMKLVGKRGLGLLLAVLLAVLSPVNVSAADKGLAKAPKAGWRYVKGYKLYYNKKGKLVKDVSGIIGKQSS